MTKITTKVYADGGARGNPGPGAAAFVIIRNNKVIDSGSKFIGNTTNNYAEYTGVFIAMKWLLDNLNLANKNKIFFYLDSELVVKQLIGKYKIKSNNLKPIIKQIKNLERKLSEEITYRHVLRNKNKLADHLVNKTLDEKSN